MIEAYNVAELLGDLPGQPGARGLSTIGADALILMDEAQHGQHAITGRVAAGPGRAIRGEGARVLATRTSSLARGRRGTADAGPPARLRAGARGPSGSTTSGSGTRRCAAGW